MLCRSVLTTFAISCMFSCEIKAHAHSKGIQRLGQIKDILCVLLMSGLQKEDIGVNTLKKLQRHNVNIHDMNNETLRQECLGKTRSAIEIITQPTEILKDQNTLTIATTDKSYDFAVVDTRAPDTLSTITNTRYADQGDEVTNKELLLQREDEKRNNASVAENTKEKHNANLPTLENVINLWNKMNNNTKVICNTVTTDVTITPATTTDTVTKPINEQFHPSAIEYLKNMLGYIARQNFNMAQNTTNRQDIGDFKFANSRKDIKDEEKLQESFDVNNMVKNIIVTQIPYKMGERTFSISPIHGRTQQQRSPNNADVIYFNDNSLVKDGPSDDLRKLFVNQNKLYDQPKQELLVNEPHQGLNIASLMQTIVSPPHTSKRELNDIPFQETNSQRRIGGAAASEFYPRIAGIGQTSHYNDRDINDVPLSKNPRAINNNFGEKSMSTLGVANLEDWYSDFFRNNIENTPSMAATNNRNELVKESLFDTTYTFNNDNKYTDKSKEIPYMAYSPIRGRYNSLKILPPVPYVETDNEASEINALLNNNFRATARSKDIPYPDFNPKGINADFLSDNDDPNLLTNNNKKSPYFLNNPYKNEGEKMGINNNENNDYERVIDTPFIGSKSTSDSFISRFRKKFITRPVNTESYMNHNDDYNETSKETPIPEYDQPIANPADKLNILMNDEVESAKIMPPFLESMLKLNSNPTIKQLNMSNNGESKIIPASEDVPTTNNKNRTIKNTQNMQYNLKASPNTLIQGDQLRLIKNSLQYINQILEMNEGLNRSSVSDDATSEKATTLKVTTEHTLINITNTVIQSNQRNKESIKHIKGISADLINEIAESVKKIILGNMKTVENTEKPEVPTTSIATTITTTEKTTVSTTIQGRTKTIDANYVVQKIMELFKEFKTGTHATTSTTTIPPKLLEAHVTKYVYTPSKIDQPPPMPAFNPHGVQPEISHTNFTNLHNQVYNNPNNSNKDSLQTHMPNQTSQIINRTPQILNHKLQILNQPPQYYNQPLLMPLPPIMLNNLPPNLNQIPPPLTNQAPQMIPGFQINRPPQQVTNQGPQTIYNYPPMLNQPPQLSYAPLQINTPPQLTYQALQNIYHFPHVNPAAEVLSAPSQMYNQPQQMAKDTRQIVNRLPQVWNQSTKNMNHAQQILNQALQMKTQVSHMTNDSPEMSNQSPQIDNQQQRVYNQGLQMRNQGLPMMNNYAGVFNQPQNKQDSSQMKQQLSNTKATAPLITIPLTSAFQSSAYITFQTNSNEIPPLGIPIDKPKRFIDQVVILTTGGPFKESNDVSGQWGLKTPVNEKRKKSRADITNKMRVPDSPKQHVSADPSRNKSIKQRVNEYYRNYSGNHREVSKQRHSKKADYERARPRYEAAKKFHEQLERLEDGSKADRKRSRERIKESCGDVPSRQQVPLTKLKQRSKYDDTHFRNFLKTQEKVNNMLEALLATKKIGRPRSVETP